MKPPAFSDLRAFMMVADKRSFRVAADQLGVTPSALSHTIRSLEERLAARLLHRTTRSVSLTEAGDQLIQRLAPLLAQLDQTLEDFSGSKGHLAGTLRINGSVAAIGFLLKTVAPAFLRDHPCVQLDFVAEGRFLDIVEHGFDAGVRLAEAVPKDMVAVPLGSSVRFLAVVSPSYLDGAAIPQIPDDLAKHTCIRQRLPSGKRYRWEFRKRNQEVTIDVPGALTLDNSMLMVEAAIAGLGIAYVPESFAQNALSEGSLVTVLEDWCPHIPGLCLYFPRNRHMPPNLRAFIDMIRQS